MNSIVSNKKNIKGWLYSSWYLSSLLLYINQGQLYDSNIFTILSALSIYGLTIFAWFFYITKFVHIPIFSYIACFICYSYFIYIFSDSSIYIPFTGERVSTMLFCNYSLLVVSSCLISYILTVYRFLKERILIVFGFLFALFGVLNMLYFMNGADMDTFTQTNNYGYNVVAIVPILPLIKKKVYINFIMLIVLLLTLISLKRGAILLSVISFFVILFFQFRTIKKVSAQKKLGYVICFLIVSLFLFELLLEMYNNSVGLYMRIEQTIEGGSSSRDSMYESIILNFFDSNIFNAFFGHGIYSTVKIINNYAHNDYLEVLYDLGIIGFYIFVLLYLNIVKQLRFLNINSTSRCILNLVIVYVFVKSLFSMCVYDFNSLPAFIMLGYVLGNIRLQNQNK